MRIEAPTSDNAQFPVVQFDERLVAGATIARIPTMSAADQECGRRNLALAMNSQHQQRGGADHA
jgi:hypothetical protein